MGLFIMIAIIFITIIYKLSREIDITKQHYKAVKENTLVYMNDRGETRNTINGQRVKVETDITDHMLWIKSLSGDKLVNLSELIREREREEAPKINEKNDEIARQENRRWSIHLEEYDPNYSYSTKVNRLIVYKYPYKLGKFNNVRVDLKTGKEFTNLGKRSRSEFVNGEIIIHKEYYIVYKENPYKEVIISEEEAKELGVDDYQWYKKTAESSTEMYNRVRSEFYKIGGLK